MDIYIYQQTLILETWNLALTLGDRSKNFFGIFFGLTWTCTCTLWFDLKLDIYIYQQLLVLEPSNFAHSLCAPFIEFLEIFFVWLELLPFLNGLTWNWTFTYTSNYFWKRLQIWRPLKEFLLNFFLVWLELVPAHNGLTWKWTFTYISKYLWQRLETWYTPWGDQFNNFGGHYFLVWLVLLPFNLNMYLY